MRKSICIAMVMVLLMSCFTGCGKKDEEKPETGKVGTETIGTEEKTDDATVYVTPIPQNSILAQDLQGSYDGTYYYNKYFNIGVGFTEVWKVQKGSPEDFDKWLRMQGMSSYSVIAGLLDIEQWAIMVDLVKLGDKSDDDYLNKYCEGMTNSMKEKEYELLANDKVYVNFQGTDYPAIKMHSEGPDGTNFWYLGFLMSREGFRLHISVSAAKEEHLLGILNSFYVE